MTPTGDKTKRERAVALRHQHKQDAAPRITASGLGANAEKIVALALAHGVAVREDGNLAEILTAFEVDSLVPIEALNTVAEILSYLYQLDGRLEEKAQSLEKMRQGGVPEAE